MHEQPSYKIQNDGISYFLEGNLDHDLYTVAKSILSVTGPVKQVVALIKSDGHTDFFFIDACLVHIWKEWSFVFYDECSKTFCGFKLPLQCHVLEKFVVIKL